MDVSQIALNTLTVLAPYLIKGGEQIASEVSKELWSFTKGVFKSDKEKRILSELEASPNSPIIQGKFVGKLEEILEADPDLTSKLQNLLAEIPAIYKINKQLISGNGNVTMQDVNNGSINIGRSFDDK